nr:MAG: capsid protein [Cressdnaviricota sp.]
MAFKKFSKKHHGAKGKKRVVHKKKGMKMTFAKKVMAVVHKKEQVKYCNYQVSFAEMGPYGGATPLQFNVLANLTNIGQGTGQGDRLGNKIHIKRVIVRAVMFPLGYDPTLNVNPYPSEIRVICGTNRQTPQAALPVSQLYQNGDSYAAPAGDLRDIIAPINKDVIKLWKSKTFKVGNSLVGGTGYLAGQEGYTNNDFHLNQKFTWDLTKYCAKTVIWEDGATTPLTPSCYMLFMLVNAAGNASTNIVTASITYNIEIQYTDF